MEQDYMFSIVRCSRNSEQETVVALCYDMAWARNICSLCNKNYATHDLYFRIIVKTEEEI